MKKLFLFMAVLVVLSSPSYAQQNFFTNVWDNFLDLFTPTSLELSSESNDTDSRFTEVITSGKLQDITKPQLAKLKTEHEWNGTHFYIKWEGNDGTPKELNWRIFALTNISGNEVRRYIPENTKQCVSFGWNKTFVNVGKWKQAFWIKDWNNTPQCQTAKNNLEYLGMEFDWTNFTPTIDNANRQVLMDELVYDYNDINKAGMGLHRKGNIIEIHNVKALQQILIDPLIGIAVTFADDAKPVIVRDTNGVLHLIWKDTGFDLQYAKSLDNGNRWNSKVVDTMGGLDAKNIVINSTGGLHIIYGEASNPTEAILHISSSDYGNTWSDPLTIPGFDGDSTHEFDNVDAVVDTNDNIHICVTTSDWEGSANDFLMYSNFTAEYGWIGQINVSIDAADNVNECDIATDSNNLPYIVGIGRDGNDMEIWNKGVWGNAAEVTIHSSTGDERPDIYIDTSDVIHTVWEQDSNDIGYANSTPDDPTTWTLRTIDTNHSNNPHVVSDVHGNSYIMYSGNDFSTANDHTAGYLANSSDGWVTWTNRTVLFQNLTANNFESAPSMRGSLIGNDFVNIKLDYIYNNDSDLGYYFDVYELIPTHIVNFTYPTDANNSQIDRNYTSINFTVNMSSLIAFAGIEWNGTNITTTWVAGLVGLWHLNNDTLDYSGSGNNGIASGGVNCSTNVEGQFGTACDFDGGNDKITIPLSGNFAFDTYTEMTIAFWANTDILGSANGDELTAVSNFGEGASARPFSIEITQSDTWSVFMGEGSITSGATIGVGEWHHVVGVWISSTSTEGFLDGVSFGKDTTGIGANMDTPDRGTAIGVRPRDLNDQWFNGKIDEVRVWDRALSADEISVLWSSEVGKYFANVTELNKGAYQYFANVTELNNGTYQYRAWANNVEGEINFTELRTLCVGANFADECVIAEVVIDFNQSANVEFYNQGTITSYGGGLIITRETT